MGLYQSVADWVLKALPYDRNDSEVVNALRQKRPDELLVLYLNWQSRLITPRPRRFSHFPRFYDHPGIQERLPAVLLLVKDVEQGCSLTKYLSRRVQTGFSLPPRTKQKNLNKLQYLDLLLNDWGVHHLHLSDVVEDDGFIRRCDTLLFGVFRPDEVFILDVGTHSSFSDEKLVHSAITNWPHAELFLELKGLRPPRSDSFSNADRSQIRKAGLASAITINGKMYSPPGGLSTAGTSIRVSMQANKIMRTLRDFERQIQDDPKLLISALIRQGGNPSEPLNFAFTVFETGFGVIETTSGLPIRLG